jgi:hypothetical protein
MTTDATELTENEQKLLDGTLWGDFCDLLKYAGETLQREGSPKDMATQAEGIRYLTRLTRAALETFVEHADPLAPVLQRVVHETAKMGADNPDNFYLNAAVDGRETYRLHGLRHTVQWLEFATQQGSYGQSRGMPPTGRLDGVDMTVAADGTFDVVMSATEPALRADGTRPDWLPMQTETGTLIVRQSRLDHVQEELAEIYLERLGPDGSAMPATPGPLDADRLATGLLSAGLLVPGASAIFAGWAEGFQDHVNQLPRFDQELSDQMGGVPEITYHHSAWRLAADECLVIEAMPPSCDHWNFQLNNHWMESLDYRYHRIHTNSAIAATEPDGSIRIVVSHGDPGHPNWIRTDEHTHGTMCFRWVRAEVDDPEAPSTRVVRLADLRVELASESGGLA